MAIQREAITVTTSSGSGTATGVENFNGLIHRVKLVPPDGGSANFALAALKDSSESFVSTTGTSSATIIYPDVATANSEYTKYSVFDDNLELTIASASPDGEYTAIVDVLR